jgi:hypothetical protein
MTNNIRLLLYILVRGQPLLGGHEETSSILADQWRPRIWAQMRGDGGELRGLSQCVQLYTSTPNKLTPYLTHGHDQIKRRNIYFAYVNHQVRIYPEYHSVCPLVRIGTPHPSFIQELGLGSLFRWRLLHSSSSLKTLLCCHNLFTKFKPFNNHITSIHFHIIKISRTFPLSN